jgi:WD40 repeat protein
VFDVNFSPFDNNLIVSCGVKHVSFWLLQDGQLKQSKGLLAGVGVIQTMHCMAFPAPEVTLVGTARGEVYIFQGHKLSKVVPGAHKGGTTALYADKDAVVSGGNDGLVRTWKIAGNGLEPVDSIQLEPVQKQTAERAPLSVRSIAVAGEAIAVGTASSQIILVQGRQPAIINQGLSTGEVWGLATHPRDHLFVTAAEDKSVRLWNADTNVQLSIVLLPYPALCADWSADGSTIAVGGDKGNVTVLNAADLATLKSFKDRKEDISQVKFSPDGTRLAVGSHDNFVDVYEVPSFKKLGTCSGHSSYITHVDWSADTRWLQSTDGAYELLFWDAATCRQETYSSRLRDVEWATWTCTLGWPVQGIWPRGADGTDINAVSRSHGGHLLATADDFGLLKLFAYPAVTPGMPYHRFMGHSAHVTEVAWLNDDSHILTTGGGDRSIFKWEVTK